MDALMLFKLARLLAGILLTALPVCAGQYTQDFNSFFLGQVNLGGGLTLTSSIPNGGAAHIEDAALKELQLSSWDVLFASG